ncbi:MAG: THUMP domain-containing protein [Nanoarchaeota archaeon]|nr:THUMP domain-containing protein [Nanoarchaeota archaeon]
MDPDFIIVRYGELFLKGRNRRFFERKLIDNIKKKFNLSTIYRLQGRLMLNYFQGHASLRDIFGLVSYSPAWKAESDLSSIQEQALAIVHGKKGTFRVMTKRSDKNFPLTSIELNRVVGKYIEENSNLIFAMETPDQTLYIEINEKGVYLFTKVVPCHGGIPTGAEGKVLLLLEDDASVVAGILMMKRGAFVVPVSFQETILENKKRISLLQKFSPVKLNIIAVASLPDLENYAVAHQISVLVTGESFQELALSTKKLSPATLIIFRPLISYSQEEIISQLEIFSH